MSLNKKILAILGSLALFLGVVALIFYLFPPKAERGNVLRRVDFSRVSFSACQDERLVEKAIETSISILKTRREREFPLLGKRIRKEDLLHALNALKSRLEQGDDLAQAMAGLFEFYELERDGEKGRLLVTGYYQPLLHAATEKREGFSVPVLGVPRDLVQVRLRDFDSSLPPKSLWGQVKGNRLVPYYSRLEIDRRIEREPDSLPVLCWLSSPVDLLELQIQGSGIILLENERRFIHYAASNGRPYVSLGRLLLGQGILPEKSLDWPSIRAWAEENPRLFNSFLSKNERYIFFKWEDRGPIGCFGKVLVPGVSAALDRSFFPPGIPLLVTLILPDTRKGPEWLKNGRKGERKTLLVMNHDTGSAIKGPFRMDLYAGTGEAAGELAGHLKSGARMIFLLPTTSLK